MRDITHKQITLRTAKAIGIIFCAAFVAAITYAGTHMANRFNQL